MKEINMNQNIYFRLNEDGKKRLSDPYFAACVKPVDGMPDIYTTQFWTFCGLFGDHMRFPGDRIEVELNVRFEDKDLKEVQI